MEFTSADMSSAQFRIFEHYRRLPIPTRRLPNPWPDPSWLEWLRIRKRRRFKYLDSYR